MEFLFDSTRDTTVKYLIQLLKWLRTTYARLDIYIFFSFYITYCLLYFISKPSLNFSAIFIYLKTLLSSKLPVPKMPSSPLKYPCLLKIKIIHKTNIQWNQHNIYIFFSLCCCNSLCLYCFHVYMLSLVPQRLWILILIKAYDCWTLRGMLNILKIPLRNMRF